MAISRNTIPMRWPSGPLDIARQEGIAPLRPQDRQVLERWHEPAALSLLDGSPIDCIVVSWAAGLEADAEQQRTALPLIEAARRRSLAVVGLVEGRAGQSAVASARAAGLTALATSGAVGDSGLPAIPWIERANVPWDSAAPAVAVGGNVWPGVAVASGSAATDSGPTGLPWLDSNSWYIQMARARLRAPLWVVFDPPGKGTIVSPRSYVTAICDSEAAGGRWVISLDRDLRAELTAGSRAAVETWKQLSAAARFFGEHAEWKEYHSLGLVGVISDFTGDHLELSGEILNLMARRDLFFRVIWKSQAASHPFTGLKALVYADDELPGLELRRKIDEFVEQGGLLIAGPKWPAGGKPVPLDFPTQFDVRAAGKGRLAMARGEMTDAYQVAVDTQFLLSHRNDLVKIYNSASSGCTRFAASPDGKKAVLQCLSYADSGRGGLRTVWLNRKYRSTRLWAVGSQPAQLEPAASEEYVGVEYHVPAGASQSYLALELEG